MHIVRKDESAAKPRVRQVKGLLRISPILDSPWPISRFWKTSIFLRDKLTSTYGIRMLRNEHLRNERRLHNLTGSG